MTGYVALGSNLGDRRAHLRQGIRGLRTAGIDLLAESSVWETAPVDSPEPLWFLNMAVKVRTARGPLDLLDVLLAIEADAGRRRGVANAPRTLDLDLLLLGDLEWHDERLELPHPRMWDRGFVLGPLAEIAPDLRNPRTGRSLSEQLPIDGNHGALLNLGPLGSC